MIDQKHGKPTSVAWCLSKRTRLDEAAADLQSRESTSSKRIGRMAISPDGAGSEKSELEKLILTWARERNVEAVVWTALESNFTKKQHKEFSVAAALAYVKTLHAEGKAKAAEYVWRAPTFVTTPVRSALQREPWFSE